MGGGKNTTVKRIKESINRGIEYFCNVEIGVFRIISPATKPAQINMVCLKKNEQLEKQANEAEKDMSHPKINKAKIDDKSALSGICLVRMFGFNLIDKSILYFY